MLEGCKNPLFAVVIELVAKSYYTSPEEILSHGRFKNQAAARQMLTYLLRKHGKYSYPELAVLTKRGDHTTAMSAVRTFEENLEREPPLKLILQQAEEELRERLGRPDIVPDDTVWVPLPRAGLERLVQLLGAAYAEVRALQGQVNSEESQEEEDDNRTSWKKHGPRWAYVQPKRRQGQRR